MSRSLYKGLFFKLNLLTDTKYTKIYNKNLIILPEYINYSFYIYNGIKFIFLKIQTNMIGYKFGEFIYTKKKHIFKKKKNKL